MTAPTPLPTLQFAAQPYRGPSLAGHIVSWRAPAATTLAMLRSALTAAGFDAMALAPDLTPEQRLSRVATSVARADSHWSAKRLARSTSRRVKQLTVETVNLDTAAPDGVSLGYTKQDALRLDPDTGSITAESGRDMVPFARVADEYRTGSDVGQIVQRIVWEHGRDLIPIRPQGGAYFIPAGPETEQLVGRLAKVLYDIGGRLFAFSCLLGQSPTEDASIALAVTDYLAAQLAELREAVAHVTDDTRADVAARRMQDVANLRQRLAAYASMLAGQAETITADLDKTEAELLAKVAPQLEMV